MDDQKVIRVIDARRLQKRVVLWMACGHKISVPAEAWHGLDLPTVGETLQCPYCPDPPPKPPPDPDPRQMWRDAGEP